MTIRLGEEESSVRVCFCVCSATRRSGFIHTKHKAHTLCVCVCVCVCVRASKAEGMPPHTVEGSGAKNILPQGESLLMTPHVRDDDVWKKKDLCVEDFKPVKAVGNGDMGTVFLVVHESTNMPYAMKVMKKDALVSKNTTIRAQTEKDILSSLQHPFLPSLLATFESEKHSFLVMDYCTGGDLNVLRQRQPEKIFSVSAARYVTSSPLPFAPLPSCFAMRASATTLERERVLALPVVQNETIKGF